MTNQKPTRAEMADANEDIEVILSHNNIATGIVKVYFGEMTFVMLPWGIDRHEHKNILRLRCSGVIGLSEDLKGRILEAIRNTVCASIRATPVG